MTPLPKRRLSKQRSREKAISFKVSLPKTGSCPSCGKSILSHRVCLSCGNYRGRLVVTKKEKKRKSREDKA
ncbi:MAG: 50S ribosomal protein L32 [bacterium]|nr:50S ribosomal protein L32 [bacterium]